ncbi:sensor histidine kinase [Paenibacillus sp. YN15]|uniref:cache domain-containing sensor histidine kinase n=1 Tax=Paenibacillus sp. YN15 TaxID=1742774 RepID=UPI000DCD7684|nr:histidine kinase [Paenibacillus sp. YN15]RAU96155.1 two-component sensor histidine kinase [Paenibacillus sp. YN15]
MRALWRWVRSQFSGHIQVRLTGYFLLILLPLVVISLFAVERSRDLLYQQAVERSQLALSSSMDYIDLTLQNIEELSALIATDPAVVQQLNKTGKELPPESIVEFSRMLKQLSNMNAVNHIVSQITVYHHASHMMISTNFGGRRLTSEPMQEWMVQTAREKGTAIRYVMPDESVSGTAFGSVISTDSISLVRSMDLYNVNRQPNVLMITLNKSRLLGVIKSQLPSPQAKIYLHTETGRVVAGTGEAAADGGLPAISGKEMAVTVDSGYSNWHLTMMQPEAELYRETDKLRAFTYVIIAVSVLLAVGISWVVYSGIASPVHKLAVGMKQLSAGNLNIRLANRQKDEFGYLTEAFNRMVAYQRHLIEDHYEQELELLKTELKFLQSQINPHFLYNTLDSIYWSAQNYEATEISEMVLNLSRFFRLSLNKGREVFTLQENMEHLHYYIRIQQIRFLDNFRVEYRLQEETKNVPMLKLLLQPLVENAILHGMEDRASGGLLVISSWIEGGSRLNIRVEDNGPGIEPERLAYMRHELEKAGRLDYRIKREEEVRDLFGLRNVIARMKLYYGKGAELVIDSVEGQGTFVTVSLPLDRCGSDLRPMAEELNPAQEGLTGG